MARRKAGNPGHAPYSGHPRYSPYALFTRRQRRLLRLTRTLLVAVALTAGGIWWAQDGKPSGPAPAASAPAARQDAEGGPGPRATPPSAPPSPRAAPERRRAARPKPPPAPLPASPARSIAIPAITVEAPLMGLGLDRAGRLLSPPVDNPKLAGWYEDGPAPGENGTAVVVGHRDTRRGPAVFLDLTSLKRGNTVRVARADGLTAVFTVDRVRTYEKDEFPDEEVYGPRGRPELRLLTCGGEFSPRTGYASNIVVFAHLTDVATAV
ncbi:class F sortase [Streptomyces sp. NPDC047928]|uniref:class F sortase n=1 Tax=unclassified Streptomyces TaxID=2593676 RepID=UPI0037166A2A